MNTANKSVTIILALVVVVGASFTLSEYLPFNRSELQKAFRLPEVTELPDFQLTDHDNLPLNQEWFKGHWTMVFFGFTHCPDICPATLQILSLARQQMATTDPHAALPEILLISVDPDRDSPASLKQYVRHFGEGISGATGSMVELQKLTSALGIYFEKEDTDIVNYNVAHSAHVIVIDDGGRYAAVFSAPHEIDTFVNDMPLLMTGK